MDYSVAGEAVTNEAALSGAPAVRLLADAILLTNTERGRINSTAQGVAALVISGEGARVVNAFGGVISAFGGLSPAITGSAFADSIDNAGGIFGTVQLGGGNDLFVERTNAVLRLELDAGDDRFEIIGSNFGTFFSIDADGGAGDDTLVLGGSIGQLLGANIRNFEHLVLGPYGQNLDGLSGFRSITITARGGPLEYGVVGLLNADNPGTDIVFAGSNNLRIAGSSRAANVIGTAGNDGVELTATTSGAPVLTGSVSLGDGDDSFRFTQAVGSTVVIAGGVQAGAGFDVFEFSGDGGTTIDASAFTGFEYFNGGGWTSQTTNARITGLNGYFGGQTDGDGILTVADSASPQGSIFALAGGTLIFESTAVFGRYGFVFYSGFGDDLTDVRQGDPRQSVSFINNGTILGNVELGIGDDLYDGRLGSAGGRILGYAGNDTLRGGTAGNWIDGGFGADDLFGNIGADTLIGGDGGDWIDGGAGADLLYGGTGNDRFIVDNAGDLVFENAGEGNDTVIASVGYYLYAGIEALVLADSAGDIFGIGNGLDNSVTGNAGANFLIGLGGNDMIHGGAGVDALFGNDGNDVLNGGTGIDYLVGGAGNDTLNGDGDADALYGEDGDDLLVGGSDFQTDILVGGAGNDTLDGASGLGDYDLMDGGAGNDTYRVDTPDDLTFEAVGGGVDTVRANINGAGYYLYANTENLVLEGNTPFGVGNELDNALTGNAIGNFLLGGAGNDTLNGKAGNDVLFGEGGADIFVFERGTGGDVIGDFQPGVDKIQLTGLGFASFAQLQTNLVENGGTSALNLGNGDFIVIIGVANAQLQPEDFVLG